MTPYTMSQIKQFGFLRVAAATLNIDLADISYNLDQHKSMLKLANQEQIDLLVFPDFSLTGLTLGDLFKQKILLDQVQAALKEIRLALLESNLTLILSLPQMVENRLSKLVYLISREACQAYIQPVRASSPLARNFDPYDRGQKNFAGIPILRGDSSFLLRNRQTQKSFRLSLSDSLSTTLEDLGKKRQPSDLVLVMSQSPELVDQSLFVEDQLASLTRLRQNAALYIQASTGESTTDFVSSGRAFIFEAGRLLAKTKLYEPDLMIADLDMEGIGACQLAGSPDKATACPDLQGESGKDRDPAWEFLYQPNYKRPRANLSLNAGEDYPEIYRTWVKKPFLPEKEGQVKDYLESVMQLTAQGLAKRLRILNGPRLILGLSGGLDSSLALLTAVRAQKIIQQKNSRIICVSMPGLGTSKRTRSNAKDLADAFATEFLEIDISPSVNQHFKDIGQDPDQHDVTYENAQARERTQILMDLANQRGGLVLGTGDLSEAALGFTTYGGDHLSMYNVNCSIPKTLVRDLIAYEAKRYLRLDLHKGQESMVAKLLLDILETPVSPELLPTDQGQIQQKTEDIIGPYDLHDFFIYHFVKYRFRPRKILFLAEQTFAGQYDRATILHWLRLFIKRFFNNQFKRSAMPDGPAISSLSFSPRGSWQMPSDAQAKVWLEDLPKA